MGWLIASPMKAENPERSRGQASSSLAVSSRRHLPFKVGQAKKVSYYSEVLYLEDPSIQLQDGILLDPVSGGGQFPGTTAVIADPQVATDLSQLTVVKDQQVEGDLQWLHSQEIRLWQTSQSGVCSSALAEGLQIPMSMRKHWRDLDISENLAQQRRLFPVPRAPKRKKLRLRTEAGLAEPLTNQRPY